MNDVMKRMLTDDDFVIGYLMGDLIELSDELNIPVTDICVNLEFPDGTTTTSSDGGYDIYLKVSDGEDYGFPEGVLVTGRVDMGEYDHMIGKVVMM